MRFCTPIIVLFYLLVSLKMLAQETTPEHTPEGYLVYATIVNGDTMPLIYLREITVFPPRIFNNKWEAARYSKLVRNIKIVLPYAKFAQTKWTLIQMQMQKLNTQEEKNEFLKIAEKQLRKDFEQEIRNLTMTQGRLLIKLIDRETGKTSYELIKELKGSFNAFFYQQIARLFGENLKDEFDSKGEDKYIEEIVVRIENGEL